MLRSIRLLSTAALALLAVFAMADQTYVKLSSFPSVSVADGRSTVTITAEVRDSGGTLVPNGTQVVFNTSLGSFQDSIVKTINGYARAILIAGGIPGTAKVTATTLAGGGAPTAMDFEFVASRKDLSSAQEYIEVVAPSYMQFTNDTHIIGAAAPNRGVSIRYRDVEIQADDVQLDIAAYLVRARRAHLKIGNFTKDFDELAFRLNSRYGFGTGTYEGKRADALLPTGFGYVPIALDSAGKWGPPVPEQKFGVLEVFRDHTEKYAKPLPSDAFQFADLTDSVSTVSARKAIVFPRKGVQFQRAEIFVANSRVAKLPLFEVNFYTSNSPLVTDQLFNVNDNQIALNYPQYLSLKPGLTSLLRFHTGDQYGRSYGTTRGAFLDYELSWDKGDDLQGGMTVGGLGRNDWDVSAHQYLRIDDRTTASTQLAMPAHSSLYGSANINRQLGGFQTGLNANVTQTIRGLRTTTQDYSFFLQKDPVKVGQLPLRFYYGLTAQQSRGTYTLLDINGHQYTESRNTSGAGLQANVQTTPLNLDTRSTLVGAFTATQLYGSNTTNHGMSLIGSATLSRNINSAATLLLTYDYIHDGFNDQFIGQHRVSIQSNYNLGATSASLYVSRSLDVERASVYGDLAYRLSHVWRLSYAYTLDQYLGNQFLDYRFSLGYRIGWKEVGLTWSNKTGRLGFQVLGASF